MYKWFLLALLMCGSEAQGGKKSFIVIMTDDQGYSDVGYNSKYLKSSMKIYTPNIDKMANEGVKLETYYTLSSCTPSRTAFLTGRYPVRDGIIYPLNMHSPFGFEQSETLPNILRKNLYKTYMIGKWHLGHSKWEYLPIRNGFDTFYGRLFGSGHHCSGVEISPLTGMEMVDMWRNETVIKNIHNKCTNEFSEYSTKAYTREAIKKIKLHSKKDLSYEPFFMFLSYSAPHAPLIAPDKCLERCNHVGESSRRKYCGMVVCLDDAIAEIKSTLLENDLINDTFIIYMSDNGGTYSSGGLNFPFRGDKLSGWEGGVRVPAFIWGADYLHMNHINSLVHVTDWFATILNLADIQHNILTDSFDIFENSRDRIMIQGPEILKDGTLSASYRKGNWKLLLNEKTSYLVSDTRNIGGKGFKSFHWSIKTIICTKIRDLLIHIYGQKYEFILRAIFKNTMFVQKNTHKTQLFNLKEDPFENFDVSSSHPEIVQDLFQDVIKFHQNIDVEPLNIKIIAIPASHNPYYSPPPIETNISYVEDFDVRVLKNIIFPKIICPLFLFLLTFGFICIYPLLTHTPRIFLSKWLKFGYFLLFLDYLFKNTIYSGKFLSNIFIFYFTVVLYSKIN